MKKGDCLRSNDDSFGKRGYQHLHFTEHAIQFLRSVDVTKLVNVSFLWPEDSEEAFMAELTGYIAALCQKEAVKLGLVTAGVSSFVQKAVISVTAVGYANEDFTDNDGKNQNKTLQAGSTLCMAGHAGMAGIGLLAAYGEDALTKQYTQGFIRQAQQIFGYT